MLLILSLRVIKAQLAGVTFGLSIAGSVFINLTLEGLQRTLPTVTRDQIQAAILGTSGDFFKSLPADVATECLQTIVNSLQKVSVNLSFFYLKSKCPSKLMLWYDG